MPGNIPNLIEALPGRMLLSLNEDTSPHLRDPYDAVALFCHAAMLSIGFRLIGLGEDDKIGTSSCKSSVASNMLTLETAADSSESETKPLPKEWNVTTTSNYAFRYAHTQSSLHFLLKVSRLGRKAVINALAINDDKVQQFDISPSEYVSSSPFPYTAPSAISGETGREKGIADLFISSGRMADLWALFKINIVQKIAPGLQKAGQENESTETNEAQRNADAENRHPAPGQAQQPRGYDPLRDDRGLPPMAQPRPYGPGGDPLAPEQPRPVPDFRPPGFEDEYEVGQLGGRGGFPERRPLNIGERDLYPQGLGPHDPLRVGGPMGFDPRGGGGMHPTFDDPMFGGDGSNAGFGDMRYDGISWIAIF